MYTCTLITDIPVMQEYAGQNMFTPNANLNFCLCLLVSAVPQLVESTEKMYHFSL